MISAVFKILFERRSWFFQLLQEHIALSAIAVVIAGMLGLGLGILVSEHRRAASFVLGATNVVYTIPAIALLGLLIPSLGIGDKTAVTALIIYALLPMVRNTYAGIKAVDPDLIEAAEGMGSTKGQLMLRIKLPLAMTIILAGLRSMVVMTVSVAGIASFIGAGGLGVAIYRGITSNNYALTYAGSLLIALLALTCDALLGQAEKFLKRKRRIK